MEKFIPVPTMKEFLYDDFMAPLGISAYRLAKEIGVPVSRVQDILHGRRKVTADTSLRLGRYFGISERFFLNLQNEIDLRNEKNRIWKELDRIKPNEAALSAAGTK